MTKRMKNIFLDNQADYVLKKLNISKTLPLKDRERSDGFGDEG